MTNEEAINILHGIRADNLNLDDLYTKDKYEALGMAISALSNTDEDCISRAEAIKALEYDLSIEADGGLDKYRTVIKDLLNAIYNTQKKAIEDLPSVQPKPKTGHWIREETVYGWDGKSYQCSCCGRSIHLDTVMEDLDDYPYCHCGADMRGTE